MRFRTHAKWVGALLLGALLLTAALALAQSSGDAGAESQGNSKVLRASKLVRALADAHHGDSSVTVLAEVAERETGSLEGELPSQTVLSLTSFSSQAEAHLVSGTGDSTQARQLLSELVRAIRGAGATPAPLSVPPVPAVPPVPTTTAEATAVGHDVVVEAGRTVDEAVAVGGNLTVRGHVLKDAVAVMGDVYLEEGAQVDGDAISVMGQVVAVPGAVLGGDRVQVGPAAFGQFLPMATVEQEPSVASGVFDWIANLFRTLGVSIVLAILALVIGALMPGRTKAIMHTIRKRPGMSLLAGLLTIGATLAAIVILFITVLGIPLIPVPILAVGLAGFLGLTASSFLVGEVMPGKGKATRSGIRCVLIGMGVLTLLAILPFGSWVVSVFFVIGLGAVILSKIGANDPG